MIKITQLNSLLITFIIPVFLTLSLIWLTQSHYFAAHAKSLSIAVTLDLVITIPFIYFLLIRKKSIPKTTLVPLIIIGAMIGYSVVPEEHQFLLNFVKTWAIPFVELGVLSYITYTIFKTVRLFKSEKRESTDFFTVTKRVCNKVIKNKMAAFLATEIAVFYYTFISWKKKKLSENEFSYHKNTGTITLVIAILLLILIETAVLHLVLIQWNVTVAWLITGLSIYTALQFFALLKSIIKRPILIEEGKIYIRYGIFSETVVNINNIRSIEISTKEIETNSETRKLSPLGNIEGHNVILKLKKENVLYRFYGLEKKYKTIAFHVDEKEAFKNYINSLLNS